MSELTKAIQPALTAEEWRGALGDNGQFISDAAFITARPGESLTISATIYREVAPRVMALANAALPDDDPRKIRRFHVDLLRRATDELTEGGPGRTVDPNEYQLGIAAVLELADVLESYLPPR